MWNVRATNSKGLISDDEIRHNVNISTCLTYFHVYNTKSCIYTCFKSTHTEN